MTVAIVPARATQPYAITKDTVLSARLTNEDLKVMTYRYNVLNVCGIEAARAAIARHERSGGTYEFTVYEFLMYFGAFLPTDPDELKDSVLNTGLTVIPDAFDLCALSGDVPAIDA